MTDTDALKKMSDEMLRQQQLLTDYGHKLEVTMSQIEHHLEDSTKYSLGGLTVSVVTLWLYLIVLLLFLVLCRGKVKQQIKECCGSSSESEEDVESSIVSVKPENQTVQTTIVLSDETSGKNATYSSGKGGESPAPASSKRCKKEGGTRKVEKKKKRRVKKKKDLKKEGPPAVHPKDSFQSVEDADSSDSASDVMTSSSDGENGPVDSERDEPPRGPHQTFSGPPIKSVSSLQSKGGSWSTADETVIPADPAARKAVDRSVSFSQKTLGRQPSKNGASLLSKKGVGTIQGEIVDPRRIEFSSDSEAKEAHHFQPRYASTQRDDIGQSIRMSMQAVSQIRSDQGQNSPQSQMATDGGSSNSVPSSYQPVVPQPVGGHQGNVPDQHGAVGQDEEGNRSFPADQVEPQTVVASSAHSGQPDPPSVSAAVTEAAPSRVSDSEEPDGFRLCSAGIGRDAIPTVQSVNASGQGLEATRLLANQSGLAERLRQQVLAVGRQAALLEHQLQGQPPSALNRLPSGRQGAFAERDGSPVQSSHTQYSVLDMEMTNVESGSRQGQLESAEADQRRGEATGSTFQGIRGFLSSILGQVVGPRQEEHDQPEEDQNHVEEEQVEPRVQDETAQNSPQNTTSKLIPSNFFDSPDIPPRRYQPVRQGRPSSYKI